MKEFIFFGSVVILGVGVYIYLSESKKSATIGQTVNGIAVNNANSILSKLEYKIGADGTNIIAGAVDQGFNIFGDYFNSSTNYEQQDSNMNNVNNNTSIDNTNMVNIDNFSLDNNTDSNSLGI